MFSIHGHGSPPPSDNDNDGLWTAYHVTAMALCYGATKEWAANASARQGMQALYLLQNVSGTPGLVARSVLPVEVGKTKGHQWRPAPDGKFYWKSDTSNDEIDGHYMAFYAYYEHIARHEPVGGLMLQTTVAGVTADYRIPFEFQGVQLWPSGTADQPIGPLPVHYVASGQVRLYADPGSEVVVQIMVNRRVYWNANAIVDVSLSGYLVPVDP